MYKFFTTLLLLVCTHPVQAGEGSARVLYSRWATPVHHILTAYRWPSALAGAWANTRLSSWCIPAFVRAYQINTEEAARPLAQYLTFNDFFSRTLANGARPIDTRAQAIISPGDGNIMVLHDIDQETVFALKQYCFNLDQMLQDSELVARFQGGTAFILRIAPNDYHRFHFPVAGIPSAPTPIHGRYESVQPYVFSCGVQPLQVNERHVITIATPGHGLVAFIPVGALFVGSMDYTYRADRPMLAGDESGYFKLGGSTIVLLFQPGVIATASADITSNSIQGLETPIKMGQAIAWTSPIN